jgi:hypothetical protein
MARPPWCWDFGEVVEVAWVAEQDETALMGGTPYTGSQWVLLGGEFAGVNGMVHWDGPTGECAQDVQLSAMR